jgi:protease-4
MGAPLSSDCAAHGCLNRYAELLADNRGFTPEEDEYFSGQAQHAYESFRDKAALSRGMSAEAMQAVAQARFSMPE